MSEYLLRGNFILFWLQSAGFILFVMEKLTIDRQIIESQESLHLQFLTGSPLPRIPDHTESYDQNKNNEILAAVSDGVVKPLIYHLPR